MPPPVEDLEAYRWRCSRALHWHGNRSAQGLLAEIPTDLEIDRYGAGGVVETLENEICTVLGQPAAVFMPSGTMAQQIALRIHADKRGVRSVAFHPTAHIELQEGQAYQRVHHLVGVAIGEAQRLITADDLRAVGEPLAAVLFELPQREIGGRLPAWTDLEEQIAVVRRQGAAVHLDGARLWECTPYYSRSLAQIAALFDTVYVSFYKGLGGLAGAGLAGPEDVISEARVWRTRHGGTLFGLWPNAASGLAALRKRLPLMPKYFEHARAIAEELRGIPNVTVVPDPPETPMMHLHLRVEEEAFLAAALRVARTQSVFTWTRTVPGDEPAVRSVELVVGDATLEFAPAEVATIVRQLVS